MKKLYKQVKILSFLQFLLIINISHCQVLTGDSLWLQRSGLQHHYDSVRSLMISDTGTVNYNIALQAANELILFDNNLISNKIIRLQHDVDSLQRISKFSDTTFENQTQKIRNLYDTLILSGIISLVSLVLFLIAIIAWVRRKNNIKKLIIQHDETDRLIAEYRKRMNELQSDLDNCRTQAKTILNEKSTQDKEIIRLTEEIQKARNAGLLSEEGHLSYPEKIKLLEEQLFTEATRKKILEQEILEILRKLRGEE